MKSKVKIYHLPNSFLIELIKREPELALTCKELFDIGKAVRYAALIGPGHMTNNSISSKPSNFSQHSKFVRFLADFSHLEYANKVKTLSMPYQTLTENSRDLYTELNRAVRKMNLENLIINHPPYEELWEYIPIKRGIKSVTIYSQDESMPIQHLIDKCLSKVPSLKQLQIHLLQDDIAKFEKFDNFDGDNNHRINSIETLILRAILVGHKHGNKKHPQMRHQLKGVNDKTAKFDDHLDSSRVFKHGAEVLRDGEKTLVIAKSYGVEPPTYDNVAEYYDNFRIV